LRKSRHLAKGHYTQIAFYTLGWSLLVFVLGAVGTFLGKYTGRTILLNLGTNLSLIIPTIGFLTAISSLAVTALAFFGFTVHCLLITHFFHGLRGLEGMSSVERQKEVPAEKVTGALRPGRLWAPSFHSLWLN
jgi:hypothetical protein